MGRRSVPALGSERSKASSAARHGVSAGDSPTSMISAGRGWFGQTDLLRVTLGGVNKTRTVSRHERNTIGFAQRGDPGTHEIERLLAQEPGAGTSGSLLQLFQRGALQDELADVVVEQQQLTHGAAALVARSAAFRAGAAGLERVARGAGGVDSGIPQLLFARAIVRETVLAGDPHQALGE